MYSKEKEERDWLNLTNNRIKYGNLGNQNLSKSSQNSTPLKEISQNSYINVVTPVNLQKSVSRNSSIESLNEEVHQKKTSLSELLDSRFPPKPPRKTQERKSVSRDSSKSGGNSVDGFFGRLGVLSKYENLIRELTLPKIHEHFKPKLWTFGKNFFS